MFNILNIVGGGADENGGSERKNSARTPDRTRDYSNNTLSSTGVRSVVTSPHRANAYKKLYSDANSGMARLHGAGTRKPVLEQFHDADDAVSGVSQENSDPFREDDTEPLVSQLQVFLNDCEKSQCLDSERYIEKCRNTVLSKMAQASLSVTQYYNVSSSFLFPLIDPYSVRVLPLESQFKNEDTKAFLEKKVKLDAVSEQIVRFIEPFQAWKEILPEELYHLDTLIYKIKQQYSSQCRNMSIECIPYSDCEKPGFDATMLEKAIGSFAEMGLTWLLLRIYKIDSIYSAIASSKLISQSETQVVSSEIESLKVAKKQWEKALIEQDQAQAEMAASSEVGMVVFDSAWPGVYVEDAEPTVSADEQATRQRRKNAEERMVSHAKTREELFRGKIVQEEPDEHVAATQKVTDEVADLTGVQGARVGQLSSLLKTDAGVLDVLDDVIESNITSLTTSNTRLGVLLRSGSCDMFSNIIYCAIATLVFFFMMQYITFVPKPKFY